MENNYEFIENKIKDFKVATFDAIANLEIEKDEIEEINTNNNNPKIEQELEVIWSLLNNAEKCLLNGANLYTEAMVKKTKLSSKNNKIKSENNLEEDKELTEEVKVEENIVQEPTTEIQPSIVPTEEEQNVEEQPIQEETTNVETNELPPITPPQEEVNVEENVVQEPTTEIQPSIVPTEEEPLTPQTSTIVENGIPAQQENSTMTPNASEKEPSNTVQNIETSQTFVRSSNLADKAILVNTEQSRKLRESKEVQTALLKNMSQKPSENTQEETTPEKQMEEMLGQVKELYEQGKTEEAEAMSAKISEINKTLVKKAA